MDLESIRLYCLSKSGAEESFPFGEDTLVFKVNGKIFALLSLDNDRQINLKCDPELAVSLRDEFEYVIPGYHMNKLHWNTVLLDGRVREDQLKEWVDGSYDLVSGQKQKGRRQQAKIGPPK
jgi:predicted DNA-binding protein (MmcQ/YjbR family)